MSEPDSTAGQWARLRGGLPEHSAEVMASHEGRPTVEVQNRTHGAPAPEPDDGPDPGSVI